MPRGRPHCALAAAGRAKAHQTRAILATTCSDMGSREFNRHWIAGNGYCKKNQIQRAPEGAGRLASPGALLQPGRKGAIWGLWPHSHGMSAAITAQNPNFHTRNSPVRLLLLGLQLSVWERGLGGCDPAVRDHDVMRCGNFGMCGFDLRGTAPALSDGALLRHKLTGALRLQMGGLGFVRNSSDFSLRRVVVC